MEAVSTWKIKRSRKVRNFREVSCVDLRQDESYGEKWRAEGKLIEQGKGNVKQPYGKNRSAKKRSTRWLRER